VHYVEATGDRAILDEVVPFLDGPILAASQMESYFQPGVSSKRATLFEHCAPALDRTLAVGSHGLPLLGPGHWDHRATGIGPAGRRRAGQRDASHGRRRGASRPA